MQQPDPHTGAPMDIHVHIHDHGADERRRAVAALERIAAALEVGDKLEDVTQQLRESNDALEGAVKANTPAAS